MDKLFNMIKKGLTSYQIKIIALVLMTFDHLGAFGSDIPLVGGNSVFFRQIGRASAPLFLYMISESVKYTHNKVKFIIRLYLSGLFIGLLAVLINLFVGSNNIILCGSNNIIFTFFFTALYIYLLECIGKGIKDKKIKQIILSLFMIIFTIFLVFFHTVIYNIIINNFSDIGFGNIFILENLFISVFPNPLSVEYSIIFIFMGIFIYFAKTKKMKCIVFLTFCVLCYVGGHLHRYIDNYYVFRDFFEPNQYLMVFALPFIFLYNGRRGKEHKIFFYVYYPLHSYIIMMINSFFG